MWIIEHSRKIMREAVELLAKKRKCPVSDVRLYIHGANGADALPSYYYMVKGTDKDPIKVTFGDLIPGVDWLQKETTVPPFISSAIVRMSTDVALVGEGCKASNIFILISSPAGYEKQGPFLFLFRSDIAENSAFLDVLRHGIQKKQMSFDYFIQGAEAA